MILARLRGGLRRRVSHRVPVGVKANYVERQVRPVGMCRAGALWHIAPIFASHIPYRFAALPSPTMQAYRASLLRFDAAGQPCSTKTACWSSAPSARPAAWCGGRRLRRRGGPPSGRGRRAPGRAASWRRASSTCTSTFRRPTSSARRPRACCPGWRTTPSRTKAALPTRPMPARGGRGLPRRAAAQRRHHRADLRDLASRTRCDAFFEAAQRRHLRMITGKVLQDRHSPDGVRDETEQSLVDTEALIRRWHGVDRLGYAITPRFAPDQHRRAAARRGRAGGEVPATPGSSRTWPRTRTR